MDAYERSLWNCRLGTQNAQGLKQYFFPLAAGYWRHYNSPEASFWCCTGTGAEEFAKFNDTIFWHDGESVWVNQFIPAELDWKEKGFGLRQETGFPAEQGTTLYVKLSAPQKRTIHVRVPGWVAEGGVVRVNGRELEAFAQAGSYLSLTREWKDGDKVEVTLPMSLRTEPLLGDATLRAATYGPMVLAANLGTGPEGAPLRIGGYDTGPSRQELPAPAANPAAPAGEAAEWIEVVSPKEMSFQSRGKDKLAVKPMYRVTEEKYAVYWGTEAKA